MISRLPVYVFYHFVYSLATWRNTSHVEHPRDTNYRMNIAGIFEWILPEFSNEYCRNYRMNIAGIFEWILPEFSNEYCRNYRINIARIIEWNICTNYRMNITGIIEWISRELSNIFNKMTYILQYYCQYMEYLNTYTWHRILTHFGNHRPKRSFNVLTHRKDIYLICGVNVRNVRQNMGILEIPAFSIPGFRDSGFYYSGF